MTPDELMDRISELTDADCRYLLWWLASCGNDHPDGQAVTHGLEALDRHRGRIERERERSVSNG